ncbi:ABC transporter ATP-binding protein [Escherichia coli]|uniref:ABC transporter ATP-binding protein n=1 Tax=Escherichia coli TaxID=562 RepID=UPI000C7D2503|nr:ABC transporter ATP-binding protein [Escherichia coli]AUM10836.1 macrolide ABC transporter ATP-binding protein [Escherichia coli]EKY6398853.1 ABC transporter ATP-binding protein [Escherichia coli]MBZ8327408.1 ABC transporter ATP-binding protein [Escherichia coli]QWV76957.1 ABC transporter ATP-binding protein [Escherichia coli O170:H18]
MIKLDIYDKKFKDKNILNSISVYVEEGSFHVITGPSGVGKSTLLNILGLLDSEFYGDYKFCGKQINPKDYNITAQLRKDYFSFIFQDSLINEKQSVLRNLLCSVDYPDLKSAEKVAYAMLETVGLPVPDLKVINLSGGEKQRLALARALIKKPKILLADEPTASLDRNNKIIIMNILSEYNKTGGSIIMVTHDIELITNDMNVIKLENT